MGFRIEKIDSLRKTLADLPPIDEAEREVTKQEAVRRMALEVLQLTKRGYSWETIARILSQGGLPITVQTLKSYITRAKRNTAGSRGRKSPGAANEPAAHAKTDKTKASPEQKKESISKATGTQVSQPESGHFTPRKDSIDI